MTTLTLTPVRPLALAGTRSPMAVHVGLRAPALQAGKPRSPVDVAFAIDCSGSMAGKKLRLVGQAVARALEQLKPTDRFAVVTFESRHRVLVPAQHATQEAVRAAHQLLGRLEAGGSTHLSAGWLSACDQLARGPEGAARGETDALKRTLLLTDGEANVGIVNDALLLGHATEQRARGIATSTFGVGASFNEGLLGPLADAGGGNFYFIADPTSIPAQIGAELGETVDIALRQVRLRVSLPPGAGLRVLAPYPVSPCADGLEVALPDLFSNQEVELPLLLDLPGGDEGSRATLNAAVFAGDEAVARATVALRYASVADCAAASVDYDTALNVAQRVGSMARSAALLHNRRRDFSAVRAVLEAAVADIRAVLGDQGAGRLLANNLFQGLRDDAERYSRPMEEMSRKELYTLHSSDMRSRSDKGIPKWPWK